MSMKSRVEDIIWARMWNHSDSATVARLRVVVVSPSVIGDNGDIAVVVYSSIADVVGSCHGQLKLCDCC